MYADQKHLGDGPTVFIITDDPRKDFTPALEHGRVVVMLPAGKQVFNTRFTIEAFQTAGLHLFDETVDSLLPTGDPAAIALASAYLALANDGRLAILKWDGPTRKYFRQDLNLRTLV